MRASKEARVHAAWREQAARLIVSACFPVTAELMGTTWVAQCTIGQPEYEWVRFGSDDRGRAEHGALMGAVEDLLDGEIHFDVAKAREYGERLVAFERSAGTEQVVRDWREEQGRQPRRVHVTDTTVTPHRTFWIWCESRGLPPSLPHDAMRWRQFARLGRRLLAALEGQPSECDACDGRGRAVIMSPGGRNDEGDCMACHGTGHNFGGVLPAVEWSAQHRRRARDIADARIQRPSSNAFTVPEHTNAAYEAGRESGWTLRTTVEGPATGFARLAQVERAVACGHRGELPYSRTVERVATRVVPRGEHRTASNDEPPGAITGMRADVASQGYEVGEMVRVQGYGVGRWAPRSTERDRREAGHHREALIPRWRRGELRHSEQRRERERRRQPGWQAEIGRTAADIVRPLADEILGTVREVLDDGSVIVEFHDREQVAPQDTRPRVTGT